MTFDLEQARPATLAGLAVALTLPHADWGAGAILLPHILRRIRPGVGALNHRQRRLDHDLRRKRARHWPHVHQRQPDDDL